ncbi:MAG: hypothetical protein ACKOC8_12835 [Pirellulales bacterium]
MRKAVFIRRGKQATARLREIRRRAAAWRKHTRRAVALTLIAAGSAAVSGTTEAQMGQMAMSPTGGLVNRAVGGFKDLNANGPGWLYYGINAADRGLGYQGSYMTLGGFVPYAQDDLGGMWSADLRSHLSVYGGFFSNMGAVRKQFIGGSLLGVGIFWDYDGDVNQNADTTITDSSGSYVFAGGQTYNQVGISGEWLTDFGNLRSNGYIPVGATGETMGPFVGNSLLCVPGINAGLGGADLEVGAYIPGLSDWAGMISVGGYAYGNSRYEVAGGKPAVPQFGGVYTRLDMTFIENWDFSLQYNNDSYFDSTGFARLTYRMGGSRRRNVPDQMEQPMMRNEHIVRAHQAPVQAINPLTLSPWRVIHVDNSAPTAGPGTDAAPVATLADAEALAANPYDIIFVHQGDSLNSPYEGGFTFQADNQYLVGQGTSLRVPTVDCGFVPIWSASSSNDYPVITAPPATSTANGAVVLTNGASTGAIVDHIAITGAPTGISDGVGLPSGGVATVNDVKITGNGAGQTGVLIQDLSAGSGTFDFSKMQLEGLTADGFVVDGQGTSGSGVRVNIADSTIRNTDGSAVVVNFLSTEGRVQVSSSTIDGTTGPGVSVSGGNAIVRSSKLTNIGTYGVGVVGAPVTNPVNPAVTSGTSTVQVVNSTIDASIGVQGSAPNTGDVLNLTINGNELNALTGGNGINLAVNDGKINAAIIDNKIRVTATTITTSGTTTPVQINSDILLVTSNTTAAAANNLTIKAANQDNLRALNRNAVVTTSPVSSGTAPPPNYDPSVTVPLPPP